MGYTAPTVCTIDHGCGKVTSVVMMMRNYCLPLVLFLVAYLFSENVISVSMLILAQSHFLMAYLYQYRGGKMNAWYISTALLLLLLFGSIFMFVPEPLYVLFTLATLLFSVHFVVDEITLHDDSWTSENSLSVFGFILLFNAIAFSTLYPTLQWLIIIFSITVFSYALVRLLKGKWPSTSERYLWFLSILFLFYYVLHRSTNLDFLVFFIILLHGSNWLIGYGIRLHGHTQEKRYWIETAFFLTLCAILEGIYVVTKTPYLVFFFSFLPYYCWAIAHIILSSVATLVGQGKRLGT